MAKKKFNLAIELPESPKGKLNQRDLIKISKGLGIAMAGTILPFILNLLPFIDFGNATVVMIPVCSVIVNTLLKLIKSK